MGKIFASGRIWPYAIGISIFGIFSACVATIFVTTQYASVQLSDEKMLNYHVADANANKLINAQISFDKKYDVEYLYSRLSIDGDTKISYKITDKSEAVVNDAKVKILVTRPDTIEYNMELTDPEVSNGIYTFSKIKLPVEGRWNIIAKIDVEKDTGYYNIKTSTREKEFVKEYKKEFIEY
jgi:nitrogen fixation protein FixH